MTAERLKVGIAGFDQFGESPPRTAQANPATNAVTIACHSREQVQSAARTFKIPPLYRRREAQIADQKITARRVTRAGTRHRALVARGLSDCKCVSDQSPLAPAITEPAAMSTSRQRPTALMVHGQLRRFEPTCGSSGAFAKRVQSGDFVTVFAPPDRSRNLAGTAVRFSLSSITSTPSAGHGTWRCEAVRSGVHAFQRIGCQRSEQHDTSSAMRFAPPLGRTNENRWLMPEGLASSSDDDLSVVDATGTRRKRLDARYGALAISACPSWVSNWAWEILTGTPKAKPFEVRKPRTRRNSADTLHRPDLPHKRERTRDDRFPNGGHGVVASISRAWIQEVRAFGVTAWLREKVNMLLSSRRTSPRNCLLPRRVPCRGLSPAPFRRSPFAASGRARMLAGGFRSVSLRQTRQCSSIRSGERST